MREDATRVFAPLDSLFHVSEREGEREKAQVTVTVTLSPSLSAGGWPVSFYIL